MEPDWAFWGLAVLGSFLAGMSKTGFASAASFIAVPMIALVAAPELALGLMLPVLMVVDLAGLRAYWRLWDGRLARRLCIGAVPGVAAAAALQAVAPSDLIRFLIGVIAVGFVAFQSASRRGWIAPRPRPLPPGAGYAAGTVAGAASYLSHAGGPPLLIYLLSERLDKATFQATTVVTFWAINLAKAVPYAALGLFPADVLWMVALLVPAALAGAWAGVRAHRVLPDAVYFATTHTLLLAAGGKLIWDGVT